MLKELLNVDNMRSVRMSKPKTFTLLICIVLVFDTISVNMLKIIIYL